jgi:uncharacterized protein (DUF169 family)
MFLNATLEKFNEVLRETVNPLTLPIGIKMLKDEKELPQKYKSPKNLGCRYSICQAVSASRRYGWTIAIGSDEHSCALCSVLLGFGEANNFFKAGNLACGMFTETPEAGVKSEEVLMRFDKDEYKYVLISPLSRFDYIPDVVLVYGFPAQIMRLVQGALYKSGGALTSSFTGRGGYSSIIVGTMKKNECQVILPGNGERVFGHTQDFEMAFTIPASKLEDVTFGLQETHKAGVRYPIPSYLNYEAPFPPKYLELEKSWGK